jgi:hypothetical protein
MRSAVVGLLVLGLLGAGCGSDSTPTTPSTSTVTNITEVFVGTLNVRGSSFYSFSVLTAGSVSIMLASITVARPGPTANIPVSLGVGVPAGEGCNTTQSTTVGPALTSQLTATLTPGVYCANVADVGNLTSSVGFAIRIIHP